MVFVRDVRLRLRPSGSSERSRATIIMAAKEEEGGEMSWRKGNIIYLVARIRRVLQTLAHSNEGKSCVFVQEPSKTHSNEDARRCMWARKRVIGVELSRECGRHPTTHSRARNENA